MPSATVMLAGETLEGRALCHLTISDPLCRCNEPICVSHHRLSLTRIEAFWLRGPGGTLDTGPAMATDPRCCIRGQEGCAPPFPPLVFLSVYFFSASFCPCLPGPLGLDNLPPTLPPCPLTA